MFSPIEHVLSAVDGGQEPYFALIEKGLAGSHRAYHSVHHYDDERS
jgi:hypothetical protein